MAEKTSYPFSRDELTAARDAFRKVKSAPAMMRRVSVHSEEPALIITLDTIRRIYAHLEIVHKDDDVREMRFASAPELTFTPDDGVSFTAQMNDVEMQAYSALLNHIFDRVANEGD